MTLKEQIDGLTKAHADMSAQLSDAVASHVAAQDESSAQLLAVREELESTKLQNENQSKLMVAASENVARLISERDAAAKELATVSEALKAAQMTLAQPAYQDAKAGYKGPAISDEASEGVKAESDFSQLYKAAKSADERNALYAEFIRKNKENK